MDHINEEDSTYQVKEDIPKTIFEKGDVFFLNEEHKDRLEVFTERGDFKITIDIEGKIMVNASQKSCGKKLETD